MNVIEKNKLTNLILIEKLGLKKEKEKEILIQELEKLKKYAFINGVIFSGFMFLICILFIIFIVMVAE